MIDPLAKHGSFHFKDDRNHLEVVRTLVNDFSCPVDSEDLMGNTPLTLAVQADHQDIVQLLQNEFGCSMPVIPQRPFNAPDSHKKDRTVLHLAAAIDNLQMADAILSQGQHDVFVRDYQGATPLHTAGLHGSCNVAKLLVTKYNCPVDVFSNGGHTPLHCAAQNGHLHLIRVLIDELKSNPMVCDETGSTALHQAAVADQANAARVLVKEFNCAIDSLNMALQTPLHLAVHQSNVNTVEVLVTELGATTSLLDFTGKSPIDLAMRYGNSRIIKILTKPVDKARQSQDEFMEACNTGDLKRLQKLIANERVDPNAKDSDGCTAVHLASRAGNAQIVEELVRHYKCDPMVKNNVGDEPIHLAVAHNQVAIVKMLVSRLNCSVAARGSRGQAPIHIACLRKLTDLAKFLIIDCSADPNSVDDDKNTPLHLAALNGCIDIILLLFDFKCNFFLRNKDSKLPLDLAQGCGHRDCVIELTKYMEKQNSVDASSGVFVKVLICGNRQCGKSVFLRALMKDPGSVTPAPPVLLTNVDFGPNNMALFELPSTPAVAAPAVEILLKHGSCIVVVIVDLRENRQGICHNLSVWVSLIQRSSSIAHGTVKLLIAGSYADMLSSESHSRELLDECYQTVALTLKLESEFLGCFLTVAPEMYAVKSVLSDSLLSFEHVMHVQSFMILNLLAQLKPPVLVVSVSEFVCYCKEHNIDEEAVLHSLKELEDCSLFVKFKHSSLQIDYFITNVSELMKSLEDVIYCTSARHEVGSSHFLLRQGMCSIEDLHQLLPNASVVDYLVQTGFCKDAPGYSVQAIANCADSHATQSFDTASQYLFVPCLISNNLLSRRWRCCEYKAFCTGVLMENNSPCNIGADTVNKLISDVAENVTFPSLGTSVQCKCVIWTSGIHWVSNAGVEVFMEVNSRTGILLCARGSEDDVEQLVSNTKDRVVHWVMQLRAHFVHPDDLLAESVPTFEQLHVFPEDEISSCFSGFECPKSRLLFWNVMFAVTARELEVHLEPVCKMWSLLGAELKITEDTLKRIHILNGSDDKKCLKALINELFKSSETLVCWSVLVTVLQKLGLEQPSSSIRSSYGVAVSLQNELLNENLSNSEVSEVFIETLAQHCATMLTSLAALLSYTYSDLEEFRSTENPSYSVLKKWKENSLPTYGTLSNIVRLPFLEHSFYHRAHCLPSPLSAVRVSLPPGNIHSIIWRVILSGGTFATSITSKGKKVRFKKIGFAANFPSGVIPKEHEVKLAVFANKQTPFHIPDNYRICSRIYYMVVLPELQLLQPGKKCLISIKHQLKGMRCTTLTFLAAFSSVTRTSEVLTLEAVSGGEFRPENDYCTIALKVSSLMILAVAY